METQPNIRQQIISVASKKMSEAGIRAVSVDDICHEMGISKKTFYVSFSTKDELVKAILQEYKCQAERVMQSFVGECKEQLKKIVQMKDKLSRMPDVRWLPPFVYDLNKYYPELAQEHNEAMYSLNLLTMQQLLRNGKEDGIFRPTLDEMIAADLIARLLRDAVDASVKSEDNMQPLKQVVDFTVDVLLRGMLSKVGLARYEVLVGSNDATCQQDDRCQNKEL